jgi:RimJ/RimL family protein N-acetyltransferase
MSEPTPEAPETVIETERLLLRRLTDDDLAELYKMYLNPNVHRFIGGPPAPFEEYMAATRARWIGHYRAHGYGQWAAVRRRDGKLLGRCGLIAQEVDGVREVEVGYAFGEQFWGNGYAAEAARASRDWAFRNLPTPHVISLIDPANARSIRVAERNGMTLWKTTDWKGYTGVRVYRITREEWEECVSA